MLIKFIGVPGEEHDTIHMYGQDFPLGKPVEVTDPEAVKRLSRHPHFAHKPEKLAQGDDGGSDDAPLPTREQLEAKATELGITFAKSIGDRKLHERIVEKLAQGDGQ